MSKISPKQIDWNQPLSGSLNPTNTTSFDLGTASSRWDNLFAATGSISHNLEVGGQLAVDYISGLGDVVEYSASVDEKTTRLENAMSGSRRLYVSVEGSDVNSGTAPHIPFKTIKAAVASITEDLGANFPNALNPRNYTIYVGSGDYIEDNPINVPAGVAIVGDTLRTTRLTALHPRKDFFHADSANYFHDLRFLDLQFPAFAFSFPCSTALATISNGSLSSIEVIHSLSGYTNGANQDIGILVEHADAGTVTDAAVLTANITDGAITSINIINSGSGYADDENPHISIPAPLSQRPIIVTSPYVQNGSSITGPFDMNGVKVQVAPPYNPNDIDGEGRRVNPIGAGGGIRVDGNLVHPSSPLESFVADAFTQVNQGGPGHLVINNGYAQFVSCFTTFCTYGFKVASGGFANNSNSVIDFGNDGLVSKTYFPTAFNTGVGRENNFSRVSGFTIDQDGAGYTGSQVPVVIGAPDIVGGVQATGFANVTLIGTIDQISINEAGSGYTSNPSVVIDAPSTNLGVQATAQSIISGVTRMEIELSDPVRAIEISSNMILNGVNYLVTNVEPSNLGSAYRRITTFPNPPKIEVNDAINFHKLSNISTGALVFEYPGSGVTYNALPKYGGVPDKTMEVREVSPGRVFHTTTDNIGNLRVGKLFAVDQLTGDVSISANNFNLTGIDRLGPFRRNRVPVGNVLNEVSNNSTLTNSQGVIGEDTVPTQFAVYTYVNEYSQSANDRLDELESSSFTVTGTTNEIEIIGNSSQDLIDDPVYQIGLPTDVTIQGALAVGGDVSIQGNLTILGSATEVNISSSIVNIGDNIIKLNAFSPYNRYAGISVVDSGSAGTSASMQWDSTNDYWLIQNSNATSAKLITTSTGSFGSELSLSINSIAKATSGNTIGDSLLQDTGTVLSYDTDALIVSQSSGNTTVKGLVTLLDTTAPDANSSTSRVVFRNSSNQLGYTSVADTEAELSSLVGYRESDGALVMSSVINGGTF